MATKNKNLMSAKSSEMLADFLEKNNLHKKDFAQMVGVTLSYVYNLTDETIPFSTRGTTLERIAAVMDVEPEIFSEYKIPQDPVLIDETVQYIKDKIKEKRLTAVQFLKSFPRKERLGMVDILRGAKPLPVDWEIVKTVGKVLDASDDEIYDLWEKRMKQLLKTSGFNLEGNAKLTDAMFKCAKECIKTDTVI